MAQLCCDVQFSGEWAETSNGNPFLLADSGEEYKIVIFATNKNLQMLFEADTIFLWMAHFTHPAIVLSNLYHTCFQVKPEFVRLIYLMYVIFVLHAYRYGQQFPLVYRLFSDKSRNTYIRVFELIKEKAEEQDLNLNPDTVLSDLELSIIQAMELTFPTTATKGCFFSFLTMSAKERPSFGTLFCIL